jgi:microsomal dipeptidase-like Zn-dependent dipeptidase
MHLPQTYKRAPAGQHDTPEDLVRGIAMAAANALFNAPMVVNIDSLRAGKVMVALSVLYQPFDEIDLAKPYGAPPDARYFADLVALIDAVEADIAARPARDAVVAHDHVELNAAAAANQVALIHAVEGGFHIGDSEQAVRANVQTLAKRGVAYITIAHLFFRRVATNAPAIPQLTDALYNALCPQPDDGVQLLGRALMEEMVAQKMLIDLTHMSRASIDATLRLLDQVDPNAPVVATHAACALSAAAEYNISKEHVAAVHRRHGVIGLIACEHWMSVGRNKPRNFVETMDLLLEHIEFIHAATGSYESIAIGSDMDGFIRPSLKGLDTPEDYDNVRHRLIDKYGQDAADAMCYKNALRVLNWWRS